MLSFGIIFPTGMVLGVRFSCGKSRLLLTRTTDSSKSMACTSTGYGNGDRGAGILPGTFT